MKVYIVFYEGESHDYDYIEGVYANENDAEEVKAKLINDYNRVSVLCFAVKA